MTEKRKLVRNTLRDVIRLVRVASTAGYALMVADAQWAWGHHSTTAMASDWLDMANYSDAQILEILKRHLLDRPNS